nr:hypothetical protein [Salinivirgaceae bacterium]
MKKALYFVFIFLAITITGFSQTVLFEEDFENNGNLPDDWKNTYVSDDLNWRLEDGGHTNNPSIPNSRRPPAAHSGEYNALFEKSDIGTIITKLVTPEIDLSISIKPELRFWYSNYTRTLLSPEYEKIRIYYRSVDDPHGYNWVLIHELLEPTTLWNQSIVLIPDSAHFSNIELAFEGEIGPGWGACIDDVEIIETGILPKFLDAITASQPLTQPIPTSSKNNTILRLDLKVKGNDGNLFIDTLKLNALLNTTEAIGTNELKLFFTSYSEFSTQNPISADISLTGNIFTLTNIDKNLPFGYSYIWITTDIPVDNTHTLNGKKVDFSISKNNIIVNGQKYPFTDLNPYGYRSITESIFYDDFENSSTWTLTGEFQIDSARGLGGAYGNPDPDYATSGSKILGTDLTGTGMLGDYENNIADNAYLATHQELNCKYYKDLKLQFFKWLNIEVGDSAKIQVDINSSNDWQSVWRNKTLIIDDKYSISSYDISNIADRQLVVNSRFVLGPTNNTWAFSGWNIDDYAVTGTFVHTDAGVLAWVSPGEGCGHIAPEELVVKIKNYGYDELAAPIPVEFSTNGGSTWTTNNYSSALAQDDTAEFTFTSLIDLTTPGEHHIMVRTAFPGDQDSRNDVFDTTLYILPTYSLPYVENFENGDGYWQAGGSATWELGLPSGTILNTAYSGTKAWGTNLDGNYPDNDSCWIESPCISLLNITKPIFEAMIKSRAEIDKDGLTLMYSIDEGLSWKPTPKVETFAWNWYDQNIDALGTAGWDSVKADWFMVRQTLPAEVEDVNPVKFRLVFASDAQNNNEGFAVDDIRIYEAPTDAGVLAISYPPDTCYLGTAEHIKVAIKNYGIRDFKPSDNLITSIKLDNELLFTETFNVSSNVAYLDTVHFTFTNTINMRDSGAYNFIVYTDIIGDSSQYNGGVVNDTLITTIRVNGEPDYTLGPDIGTSSPDTVDIFAGSGYSNYTWASATSLTPDTSANYDTLINVGTGWVAVTVKNANNCFAKDTINILPSTTNLGVIEILNFDTICFNAATQPLKVKVRNYSSDTVYRNGTSIQIGYQINSEENVIETFTFLSPDTLSSDILDTLTYEFTNQPIFSEAGTMHIKCFTVFTPEIDYSNDTTEKTIEIWPIPIIDLGEDTVFTNTPLIITLDAGEGLKDYKWQELAPSSAYTFSITSEESNKYYVQAEDTNNCSFIVSDTTWIITDDWKLDTILTPANTCTHSTAEAISLKLLNNSENTYAAGFKIPVLLTLDDSTFKDTISLTAPVSPNTNYTHTLSSTVDLSSIGEYEFSAKLKPFNDIDSTNNSYSKDIETYGVYYVDLGADSIVTKQASDILLDASDQFATYSWNIGWNQPTYQILSDESKLYKVTTTDEHNCATSSDSVQILASDVSIIEIKSPRSACTLGNATQISFVLKNDGNDVLAAGTAMSVYYKLDNGIWIEKPFTLPYDLAPTKTKIITVNENITLESNISYDFTLAVRYSNDFYFENDTLNTTIFEFDKPSINLGPDVYTQEADTITLQAQLGFANYQWQDFSKETFLNITDSASATYHCLVNNAYGCIGADTVNIFTYDIGIGSINSLNNCNISVSNLVTANIIVNSYDTLLMGDTLITKYNFSGTEVTETVTLTDSLFNSKPYPYTFTTPFAVSDTGNYSITCSVEMANEVDSSNNSADTTFRIGAYSFDLGSDIISNLNSETLDAGSGYAAYLWND